ncbi:unnamed protein product [Didymodactylos carnosus]|uniref:HAT C-terminal dimerisation domain-containing protein n=1 Tax=Didymodactylos carnosus TaxID=1234261 RepID=A0A8S2TFL8_9BILA|nr:unnamed protein product [Didymodactylos carnosus]CAF4284765.1 unnamed protein product [Didymodactylos carnosus]
MSVGCLLGKCVPVEAIIPDRTTVSREVDKVYVSRKNQLKKIVESVQNFSITVDFWTESHTGVSYGGVSLHYYDQNYGLQSLVLACREYNMPNQTSPNIRTFTDEILQEYGLKLNENVYAVTDNEPKMKAAFRDDVKRIGCSAHYLNKIVEHSLTKKGIKCDAIQQAADKHPSIHLVIPLRQQLIKLSQPDPYDCDAITKLKEFFVFELESKWEVSDEHFIAMLLHPNFKECSNCSQLKDKAYALLKQEFERRKSLIPIPAKSLMKPTTPKREKKSLIADCYDTTSTDLQEETELDLYSKLCVTLDPDKDDLLDFWAKQRQNYPILSAIACDLLIIPATNTTIERLFSTSGAAVTSKRTRLNTSKVDKLMFLKKNLLLLKKLDCINVGNGLLTATPSDMKRKRDEMNESSQEDVDANTNDINSQLGDNLFDDI